MNRYRAEVIGQVPYGLTHNDVFASFGSMMRENVNVQSLVKRRLAGNMISLIVRFEAESLDSASRAVQYAKSGVCNFSGDIMGPYVQKDGK